MARPIPPTGEAAPHLAVGANILASNADLLREPRAVPLLGSGKADFAAVRRMAETAMERAM